VGIYSVPLSPLIRYRFGAAPPASAKGGIGCFAQQSRTSPANLFFFFRSFFFSASLFFFCVLGVFPLGWVWWGVFFFFWVFFFFSFWFVVFFFFGGWVVWGGFLCCWEFSRLVLQRSSGRSCDQAWTPQAHRRANIRERFPSKGAYLRCSFYRSMLTGSLEYPRGYS